MALIVKNTSPQKFLPRLVAMSPYEVYLNQVRATIEPIRATRAVMDYVPPQMGGIAGQRKVIDEQLVLEVIDFEVL